MNGMITHYIPIEYSIGGRQYSTQFLITKLGDQKLILGIPWLEENNPTIDWREKTIHLIDEDNHSKTIWQIALDSKQWGEDDYWIRVKTSTSQTLEHQKKKDEPPTILPDAYKQWESVFEKKASERFPSSRQWDHAIELKQGFIPKINKIYPLSIKEQSSLDEWIEEQLGKGYIRPSKSPQASPFFFVAKKESGALRPCQDYRYLNEWTIKNAYPLPLVSDLMTKLAGAQYFTKLDLRWGYNNVRIKEGDEWKAAFITNRGLYEPTVMFFGLCNSPSTFQTMMNEYFRDMINEGWLVIYMDDILICADTKEELQERTKRVLDRLRDKDLFLKLEKCKFEVQEIEFLGMIITPGHIQMDPTKLAGIADWPVPTTVKQVRSFLGFGNFYRRFIGNFAAIAKPLTDLTKKTEDFSWTNERQQAFEELKSRFASMPVLRMPDPSKPFILQTDASNKATGAVLKQIDDSGALHPCGFISHALTAAEQNYQIYDRELLAIIKGLTTWRHLLHGSPHTIIVHCDHKNLSYYRIAQRLTPRQARWSSFLSEFDLRIEHVPGTKLFEADALSRRPDHMDNSDQLDDVTVLPSERFIRLIAEDLATNIKKAMANDDFGRILIEVTQTHHAPPIRSKLQDWTYANGIIYFLGKTYVPDQNNLRAQLIQSTHESLSSGHPGRFKTLELLKRDYWWPGMATHTRTWVEGCALCQQMKVNTHPNTPALHPIRSNATRPFQQVTLDFITDLPISDGFDSILVTVDHGLTKGVTFTPCNKTIDALGTADIYISEVYKRFGLPDVLISDRGPQFAAKVFQEIRKALKIDHRMSTAYHPQTDGETERVNQELEIYLRMFCTNEPHKWKSLLPTAEFAHNNRYHDTIKTSPFRLMYGTDPVAIPTASIQMTAPAAEERIHILKKARQEALAAHELARQLVASRNKDRSVRLEKGDKVWLDNRNLHIPYKSRKLAPKREGPFEIEQVMGPITYKLKLPKQWRIHPVFHAALLTPYKETTIHGPNYTKPPPDIISGQEEFEVEAIITHRRRGAGYHYLVKWKGYGPNDNSWEPERNLGNAAEILQQYKARSRL